LWWKSWGGCEPHKLAKRLGVKGERSKITHVCLTGGVDPHDNRAITTSKEGWIDVWELPVAAPGLDRSARKTKLLLSFQPPSANGYPLEGCVVDNTGRRALVCVGSRPPPKENESKKNAPQRRPQRSKLIFVDVGTGDELKVIKGAHATPLSAMVVSSSADIVGTVGSGDYELCKLWAFP